MFLRVWVAVALFASAAGAQVRNVVMIVSDDQRPDAVAALGNEHIRTPALDRLVARGTSFVNAYCMGSTSGAVCAPSRAMMLSGRELFDIGPDPFNLGPEITLLPEVLRGQGFETFGTGKWHGGRGSFARSFTGGESIFFGGMGSHTELRVFDFSPDGSYPNDRKRPIEEFSSAEFASAAVSFLERTDGAKPFFLYLSFTAPHDPRTPPEEDLTPYLDEPPPLPANYMPVHPFDNGEMTIRDERLAPWPRSEDVVRRQLAEYYGMITHMDREVGRVLDALDASGLGDETAVIFVSDHGLAVGSHGLMGKQNLYEHSAGAPLIVAGPGIEAGGVSEALVYLHDLPATVCDLLGLDPSWCPDSRSFEPALGGGSFEGRTHVWLAYKDVQRAIRRADGMKLIVYPKINKSQLFNLASDPHELEDLSDRLEPRLAADQVMLRARLIAEMEHSGDSLPLQAESPLSEVFDHEAAERARSGG